MLKGTSHSPESRAKMSESRRGKTRSPETRAKISAGLIGNTNAKGNSNSWKGDDIGYTAAHLRAQATNAGLPCAHADEMCSGRIQQALIRGRGTKQRVDGVWYSPDPSDYIPLCVKHHTQYDRNEGDKDVNQAC